MGQSSSRLNASSSLAKETHGTTATPSANFDPQPADDVHPSPAINSSQSSHRLSMRRGILNLVNPFEIRRRVNSAVSTSRKGNPRKKWRDSRRWSADPPDTVATPDSPVPESSELPLPLTSTAEKGKERESSIPDVEDKSEHAEASSEMELSKSSSSTLEYPACVEVQTEQDKINDNGTTSALSVNIPDDEVAAPAEDIVVGPARYEEPVIQQPSPEASPRRESPPPLQPVSQPEPQITQPSPAAPATPARQFPPPGTLVVVQGIVHTTDVRNQPTTISDSNSRENIRTSSTPRPRTPIPSADRGTSTPRNRLSTLLRSRPASTISSQPPSSEDVDNSASPYLSPPSAFPLEQTETAQQTPDWSSARSIGSNDSTLRAFPTDSNHTRSNPHIPASPTDTNATDQNGTGSSISSNSIDVLGTLLSVAAAATAASLLTGSSEPILSSGLAPQGNGTNLRASSQTAATGLGDMSPAGRAERMRQAWSTIRERLGLRSTPSNADGERTATSTPRDPVTDTRELMLAEMARAFNLGLGLGPLSPNGNASSTDPSSNQSATEPSSTEDAPLPDEGSFERFLVDLQVDLRIALSRDGGNSESSEESNMNDDAHPQGLDTMRDPDDPSDSDSEPDEQPEEQDAAGQGVDSNQDSSRNGNGDGQIDAFGRINWWRLYRFPAITQPPRTVGANGTAGMPSARVPAPMSPTLFDPTSVPPSPPILTTLPDSPQPITDSQTGGDTLSNNIVIPVIVVGLQSVNPDFWPPDATTPDNAFGMPSPMNALGNRPDLDPTEGMADFDGFGNQNQAMRGRGRGWQTRAANAIRNFRPGRRTPLRDDQLPNFGTPGSRTFLIYVIGGYYPPDHSIVTGGPNNVDSFEALLELADLLGHHMKPPTASKEDIEKSGLEIIKPAALLRREKDGTVASNCVDRCLICLDDYQEDDDVRVMLCRHAFHKDCVDKWLETGRNNCPACRSKGVNVDQMGHPMSMPGSSTL